MNNYYMLLNHTFVYLPFVIAIIVIVHHYFIHRKDIHLSTLDKWVQYNDINNHETWALFFIGIGIGIISSKYTLYF